MKVAIVIPNWNGAEMIAACLRSLQDQTHPAEIIVIDNGSKDSSVSIIETQFKSVHLIKFTENRGFAGGVNAGIRYARENNFDFVALFNNDAVANRQWLKKLVDVMEKDQETGIVSCKQLRTDKKHIDSTGDFYSIWGMPFPRGRNQLDEGQYDKSEEIFSAPAGATLYRTTLFSDIGLFDERFFAYLEDVDISFRARLAGWKIIYQPEAEVYHRVSATGERLGSFTRYHFTKNFYMLYFKNMPGWLFWKYLPLFLIQAGRLGASSLLKGGIIAYLRGFGRFLINIPYIISARRHIQSTRAVGTEQIDSQLFKQRPPRIPSA